ncbi:MAG: hypothetical protein NZM12_12275, partial [Steroidobacteraceae bacterium]|nr:hypothetical protein [Steroidobacteraceae bacterium]MDW8259648.1 hypothetical protein [Gammaproteobacteria bacterium]
MLFVRTTNVSKEKEQLIRQVTFGPLERAGGSFRHALGTRFDECLDDAENVLDIALDFDRLALPGPELKLQPGPALAKYRADLDAHHSFEAADGNASIEGAHG